MSHQLTRPLGRRLSSSSLLVTLAALLASTTLAACGRSGLRGLHDVGADGSQVGGGDGGGSDAPTGDGTVDHQPGTDGGGGDVADGRPGDVRPDGATDVPADGKRAIALAVAPSLITLPIGGADSFTATVTFSDGTTGDATTSATWTSGDAQVATVRMGRVTALRAGKILVTASTGGLSATGTLIVMPSISLVGIAIDPPMTVLPIGAGVTFTVVGLYSDGSTNDVTVMAKWTTDAPDVVAVDATGRATARRAGGATIVATVGTLATKAFVSVSAATVVQVSVLPPVATVGIGTQVGFSADATLSDGTHADVTDAATWAVDAPALAAIDPHGVATGKGVGKTLVTASFGGRTGLATLVITGATLKSLQVDPVDPSVGVGVMLAFTATGILTDGTKLDLTTQVTWQTSAPNVVQIDAGGHAVSKMVGTSVITATTNGNVMAASTVTVSAASLKSIDVSPVSSTLTPGGRVALRALGTFSDGSVVDLTDTVTWSASPAGVVSISNAMGTAGVATALAVGGAAVTATSGLVSGSAKIIVSPATLQSIVVVPAMTSVPIGAAVTLAARGTFSDGTTRDVTAEVAWASNDDSTATVANAPGVPGVVTGVKAGTVSITATEMGIIGKALVNVVAATLKTIDLQPANATTTAGLRSSYTATGTFSDGSKIDVTAQATWSTGNAMVATISNVAGAAGQLLARAAGTTTVTAALGPVSGQTNVTVTGPAASSLSITPIAISTPLGTSVQYTATLIFTNGTTRNVTGQTQWSSSNVMAATINGFGRAATVGVGTTTINALYMGLPASTTLTVTSSVVTSVEVTPIAPTMPAGTVTQFTATAIFSDATTRNVTAQATWVSSAPGVVGVSTARNRGRATAVAQGTAVITATYMGLTGDTTVTVTDSVVVEISVSPAGLTMPVGTRRQFTAQAIRSDGTSQAVTGLATWTSDAPGVAAVSTAGGTRGQVTATGGGVANISATYMGITGSVAVTVTPATLTTVQVTPFNPTISLNAQLQFAATAIFSDGTTLPVTGMATWQSMDGNVAGVSNAGGTRGLATSLMKGATKISATYMNVVGSTTLSVTDATIVQIQVTPFGPTIPVGFQRQLTATAIYSDATNRDITSLATWTTTDATVASVSDALATKGLVSAAAGGTATIQAQYTGVTGTTDVTVSAALLKAIQIAPAAASIAVGGIQALTATGTFDDASTLDLTALVTWTSSNLDVADVSNANGSRGEATGFGPGTTTIQAQRGAVTGTATLTVK